MTSKSYTEMAKLKTFKQRFDYLNLHGTVAQETFGGHRWLNQQFYKSTQWKSARDKVIIRDNGCDLGVGDRSIHDRIYIHHINPITIDDIANGNPIVFDLDNLVCVSFDTHQAIHYGDYSLIPNLPTQRKLNDTCPWK